jgi:hypothetical protein
MVISFPLSLFLNKLQCPHLSKIGDPCLNVRLGCRGEKRVVTAERRAAAARDLVGECRGAGGVTGW